MARDIGLQGGVQGRRSSVQRGFGGIVILALIAGLAATAGLFTFYRTDAAKTGSERATASALADAKTALIAYAVGRGDSTGVARPGELPCPDTDAPGTPGYGWANTPCRTTASLMGRIPWKTLGIPEPKDGTGETLWYAISPTFRDWDSFPVGTADSARRINSDTRGNITVRTFVKLAACDDPSCFRVDGVVTDAVAVIFSPGAALGTQQRGNGAAGGVSCSLTGLTVAGELCAENYLDSMAGTSNRGSTTGPFIVGAPTGTFNDQLVYLNTNELIPIVEMRVGNELKRLLMQYRLKSICQCYPWADTWPYSGGIADVSQNRGRFPTEPVPEPWGAGGIPALPEWLGDNNWHNLFWYSVSRQASADPIGCRTCSANATLTVDNLKVAALFFTPGTPLDGLARVPPIAFSASPTSAQRARADDLSLYLQDAQNNDGAGCPDTGEIGGTPGIGLLTGNASCDEYVMPNAARRDRDRLYMLGAASPATCAAHALALAGAAPCGTAWSVTNPVCIAAMPMLDTCTCAAAARLLAQPPCTNAILPGVCETALAQLKSCTQ